jgi:hypothetical protein
VREKVNEGGEDYGLFLPPADQRPGKWLSTDKKILFYDLKNGVRRVSTVFFWIDLAPSFFFFLDA